MFQVADSSKFCTWEKAIIIISGKVTWDALPIEFGYTVMENINPAKELVSNVDNNYIYKETKGTLKVLTNNGIIPEINNWMIYDIWVTQFWNLIYKFLLFCYIVFYMKLIKSTLGFVKEIVIRINLK